MPACFQLFRKTAPEDGAVKLSQIDDEICAHFGVTPHPVNYHAWWYDIIGFRLAMGKDWNNIREDLRERQDQANEPDLKEHYNHLLDITDWLEANFTADSWYQAHK